MSAPKVRPGSGEMFNGIAKRYDFVNRLMSMGQDRRWRKLIARELDCSEGARVLDLATGTADVAIEITKAYPTASVTGLDPSEEMMRHGTAKIAELGLSQRIELVKGDAQDLPWEDDSFEGSCISFGIRNVPDRAKALSEMQRVTKPGCRVVVLEAGEPRDGFLAPFVRFHIHHIMPLLGSILSGSSEYRYLQTSIKAFPPADEFCALMEEAGLTDVSVRHLMFKSVQLYSGQA
jgi:demethylmenaquinone methyltransferase/2-methoxy-6-polyprenyl-1,4-benzoquinol methylase